MAGISDIVIRRVTADDGPLLRTARLTALEDARSPGFSEMKARESAFEESGWSGRAERAADGGHRCVFLAVHQPSGRPMGMSAGYREVPRGEDPHVELVWVWVARHLRGGHVGTNLVQAVVDWAATTDAVTVRLWVDVTNSIAAALYRNCGFIDTSTRRTLWFDDGTIERRMYLPLHQPEAATTRRTVPAP